MVFSPGSEQADGGEAILARAELLSGLDNQQTAALFRAARRDDYEQIRADAKALLAARQDQAVIAESRDYLKPLASRWYHQKNTC